jgi:ABC-type bacteriocin/lantibiotic exporter with double-glycine peptidase domain
MSSGSPSATAVVAPPDAPHWLDHTLGRVEHLLHDRAAPPPAGEHPITPTLRFIAAQLGVTAHLSVPASDEPLDSLVHRVCEHANLFARSVRVDDRYFHGGIGPVLCTRASDGAPVSLIARGGRWLACGPDGGLVPLDASLRASLDPTGWQIAAGLPLKAIGQWDLFSFGWRNVRGDLAGYALLTAIAGLILAAVPLVSGTIVGVVVPGRETGLLGDIALMLLVLMVANFGVQLATSLTMVRIEGKIGSVLRAAAVARLLRMPPAEADRIPPPVMALALRAVEGWHRATWKIALSLVASSLLALPSLVLMAASAPAAALAVLVTLLLFLVIGVCISIRQQQAILSTAAGSPASWLTVAYEAFRNIETVRATGAEMAMFNRWAESFLAQRARMLKSARIGVFAGGLATSLEAALVLVAITAVALAGAALQAETSVPFVMASLSVAGAGAAMMSATGHIASLSIQRRLAGPLLGAAPMNAAATQRLAAPSGALQVAAVTYRHGADQPAVLDGASLIANPGEYIGVIGPSGSGKSTLLKLILGMLAPESGAVLLDGVDIRKLDMREVRRRIGIVGQGARLFPGTVRENICMGLAMSEAEVWQALERAGMDKDVAAMPLGLDTLIGDTNPMFSGGQVQRLLFARAIASRPLLIILDEATSALDPLAQAVVTHTIRELGVTVIAVAHRIETLRDCDRIYRVADGKVALCAPLAA